MFPKPEQPKETAPSPSPKGKKGRKVSEDSDSDASFESVEEAPKPKANFSVKGYTDNENMWYNLSQLNIFVIIIREYLGSLQCEKPSPKKEANKEK